MFNLFKRKTFGTGVIPDPRTEEEQGRDYKAIEIATFAPIAWQEKPEKEWRKFPIFNQGGSGSCCAQSVSKLLGIENWIEEQKFVHFSARDIYSRRPDKSSPGMWFQNAMDIGYRYGATFEQLMPSQGLDEGAMNIDDDRTPLTEIVAKPGAGGNYLSLPLDINAIASIVEPKGRAVLLGARFYYDEWNREVPVILRTNPPLHHAVAATNAILYNGKRALVIEDSWGISGINGRRIVTEDWFNAGRISAAWYYEHLQNQIGQGQKPKHKFEKDLKFGDRNNDITALQDCLKWEGYFPANQSLTTYYGAITAKAVLGFQIKYGVDSLQELESLGGRICGPKTRKKLNKIFS